MATSAAVKHEDVIKCNGIAVRNADRGKVVVAFQQDGVDVLVMPPVYLKIGEQCRVGDLNIEIPSQIGVWRRG